MTEFVHDERGYIPPGMSVVRNNRPPLTAVERAVWAAWNALPGEHPSPVKQIAADLGMPPADVAFIVYPVETFGRWADHQEPDLDTAGGER